MNYRESTTRTAPCKGSILFFVAIYLWFCPDSGAAALPTPSPTPELATGDLSSPVTIKPVETAMALGIDISRSAGEPSLQDFANIKQKGYCFVIVGGWGGVNPNRHAEVQLNRARRAGLLTAGYCYLNFASTLDGGRQVREALSAFGSETPGLGFVAIDVETSARNQLSQGLHREPPDASAQQQALARISEAVEEVQKAGLRAVIYTKKGDWQRVTGDSQQFKNIPLWHPKTTGGDDLNQPPLTSPDCAFGGWISRVGKQFELDTTLKNPSIPVDLDVFDLSAFSPSDPNERQPADIRIAANK